MNEVVIYVILVAASAILASVVTYFILRLVGGDKITKAKDVAKALLADAKKEAEIKKKEALLEAKDEVYKSKVNLERDIQNKRSDLNRLEKRLVDKETNLDRKVDILNKKERGIVDKEKNLDHREKGINHREKELDGLIVEQNKQLEKIAGMTSDEAKKLLMENLEGQAKIEAAAYIKEIREKAERDAEKEAKEIITQAIYRCAADHTVESTVSVVSLPNDEMKGRIIGREGRNIRSFETATGIDVIVDDTPEAVILSGYDPIRREIARMALENLVSDGRIHPARIEEVIEKCSKEMELMIREGR